MSDLTVYSYGMGEFVFNVFNAVSATIYGEGGGFTDGFGNAIKIAFLLSFTISVYKYILTKSIPDLTKNMFLYIGVTTILLMPSPRALVVKDEIIGRPDMTISNVPMGLALPASLVSTGFFELTRLVETSFHHIRDLNYSKSGFLFGSHVIRNASQVKITDPDLNQSLKSYVNNCVFYDIYLGAYTFKDLLSSENTWELITKRASGNRAFELDGKVTVCKKGVEELGSRLNPEIDNSILKYARYILPSYNGTNEQVKNKVISSVENGYRYLANNSQSAAEILRQNILINAVNEAAIDSPESGMYSYAVTRANAQKAIGNVSIGIMMARWLPAMQGAMEAMMYSCFILVCLFALFTNGEKVISNYIITLTWLSSWPVVYAVMNFGFTWVIAMRSSGLGLSFYDNAALSQIQTDMSSLFGYFSLSVPYFAWGLINLGKQGLGSVFTQMSQLVGSSTQSLSMAASGEAVTGNYSLGNTSFDNHSMHNTSGFKYDTNSSFMSGNVTSQLGSGTVITTTGDGTSVVNMDSAISRLNTGINISERISASATEQADKALSAARTDQMSFAENFTSSMRNLYDIGKNINISSGSSDASRFTASGGYSEAASDYAVAVERFAADNNLSEQDAARYLAGAYANLSGYAGIDSSKQGLGKIAELFTGAKAGWKVSGGVKGEADRVLTNQEAENFTKAREYVANNNLTKTFDIAYKGLSENSYTSSTNEGKTLTESANASYDKAKNAAESYSSHIQESESYRELASYTSENSASFNINANQEFLEFVASMPLKSGQGSMGVVQAELLLRENSELRAAYAEQFITEKTEARLSNWKSSHLSSSNVSNFNNESNNIVTNKASSVRSDHEVNKLEMKDSSIGHQLNNDSVDKQAQFQVNTALESAQNGVVLTQEQINLSKDGIQSRVKDKVKEKSDE